MNQKIVDIGMTGLIVIRFRQLILMCIVIGVSVSCGRCGKCQQWGQLRVAQTSSLNKFLAGLSRELQLADSDINSIRESTSRDLSIAVEKIVDRRKEMRVWRTPRVLDRGLRTAVLKKMVSLVPPSKAKKLSVFTIEQQSLDRFDDARGQNATIVFLNRHLCLSENQETDFLKLFSNHWDPFWNEYVDDLLAVNDFVSGLVIFDQFPRDELVAILTEQQLAVLDSISNYIAGINTFRSSAKRLKDNWSEHQFRSTCNDLMDLHLDSLRLITPLNSRAEKILSIGSKGAVAKVTADRSQIISKLPDEDNVLIDAQTQSALGKPILPLCLEKSEFKKALQKAFDAEQYQAIKTRQLAIAKREARFNFDHVWFKKTFLTVGIELNLSETIALDQLINQIIDSDKNSNFDNVFAKWLSTKDQVFIDVLTESNWEKLKLQLDVHRQNLSPSN